MNLILDGIIGLNENYLHDSFYMVKIVLWRLQSL